MEKEITPPISTIAQRGFAEEKKCIDYLKKVFDRDGSFRQELSSRIETTRAIDVMSSKLELALNILKKFTINDKNSFSSILNARKGQRKEFLMTQFYACILIRVLHLKMIDCQNLLKQNEIETAQKCKEFWIEQFDRNIKENIIMNSKRTVAKFLDCKKTLNDCIDIQPRRGDCAIWNQETNVFNNEIVRYFFKFIK